MLGHTVGTSPPDHACSKHDVPDTGGNGGGIMERQSSRIYFQGHYHKDIYFQGHYHKAMYLTDNAGNATLVWEKIRGTPPARISLIESIGDRYYGIGSIKGGYYGWGDLFEADSPYGLILAERSGRRDQVIIIREPDG